MLLEKHMEHNMLFVCFSFSSPPCRYVTWCCVVCSHMLWLVIVSLCLLGLGFGAMVVTFNVIAEATQCVLHAIRCTRSLYCTVYTQ